ncbi:MAG: glycerol-3-phosphate 1-O-acyltransferase PlsY [Pseudomonadota bacterium]
MTQAFATAPLLLTLALISGYLLGAIPFGLILTRLAGLGDVRQIGSGNIGATNVLRTGRKGLAAATLALDAAKGAGAVLLTLALFDQTPTGKAVAAFAGLAAILGHMFPFWLRFKGGKGVATAGGVLAVLHWPTAVMSIAIWLAVALITRVSSLAALLACGAAPFLLWGFGATPLIAPVALMVAFIVWAHRANIARLRAGSEPRIGQK